MRQDDIGGLDIAMHDRTRMSRRQALRHLDADVDGFGHRERTAAYLAHQRFPRVIRHHDEGAAVAGFLQAMNHANVGMVE